VDKEKFDLFIDIYEKRKDDKNLKYYIYLNKYDTIDDYTSLRINKYEDGEFYVNSDYDENFIINKNDEDLWSFEIYDIEEDYTYDETDDLLYIKKLLTKK
jgi:hypothetical protein